MNILILNGNPDLKMETFDRYLQNYQLWLHHLGFYVKTYHLRNLNLEGCERSDEQGNRTDNIMLNDDFRYIINSLKDTDLVVFAGPLCKSHFHELTAKVQSRIAEYFQQHMQTDLRQGINAVTLNPVPLFGVIAMQNGDDNQQELLLNKLTQERIATNLRTLLSFCITTAASLTYAVSETLRSFEYNEQVENTSNEMVADYN